MATKSNKRKHDEKKFYFKKKKKPLTLVFDENARKEFLTGFHKRKVQRQKKARQELETQLKEERKRLKAEAKETYKNLGLSFKPIPELEEFFPSKKIELENHSISITELSHSQLAKQNNWIGKNQVQYDEPEIEESVSSEQLNLVELPGMELTQPRKSSVKNVNKVGPREIKTKKDLKKIVKNEATKQLKKSKIFQRKNKIERFKNIKEKRKKERREARNKKGKKLKLKKK